MSLVKRVVYFFRHLFRGEQVERELDAEVQSFFDVLIDRYMSRGLSRQEALRAARLKFESPERVKENVRDERRGVLLETMARDVQYAWRALRTNPGFTTVAVMTLGLAIGANTAIFSLINTLMVRLLPVQHPEQLVLLTDPADSGVDVDTTQHGIRSLLSYPEFEELRSHNQVFSGLLAAQSDVSELDIYPATGSQSLKAHTQLVSGNFFQVLGVEPLAGRFFTSREAAVPGANPIAVISYGYWQQAFGGDPKVVGSTLRVGRGVFQVSGIAPPGFHGILVGSNADFWLPITMQEQVLPGRDYLTPRDTLWLQVMGRLLPGISIKRAQAGINSTFQQFLRNEATNLPRARQSRETLNERIELRGGAHGASAIRGAFSDPLILLMAMVGIVLLIACANIANLLLARASGRQREIGVRLALGAARGRLIRQLLTESLLISVLGGVVGLFLSIAATHLMLAVVSTGVENLGLEVPIDSHVLLFAGCVCLVTGLVFGLAPALRGTRPDINRTLAANPRGSLGERHGTQARNILVVAQVALSLILLMSAVLFVRSLHKMLTQDLGYDRNHLLMITVDPVAAGYNGPRAAAMYEGLREQLEHVRGVRSATISNDALFTGDSGDQLSIEGSRETDPEKLHSRWTEVGADYFRTLGIPLRRGHEIAAADAARNAPVCVVNETFLQRFFPDGNALGKHIRDEYPSTRETFEIIGIVADSKEHSPDERKEPRFYSNISHPIGTAGTVTYLLSTFGQPASVAGEARKRLQQFDRNFPILSIRTVTQQLDRSLIAERLLTDLAAFFAMLALLMAAVGLYGVISYSIARRTSEIGVRMALGASRQSVIRMVFGETLRMVLAGVVVGLPCGFAVARMISSKLYAVNAGDPFSAVPALLIILASAVLAGYVPAHRASRVDPMLSLRHD
jgi:predicted permease